MVTGPSGSGKSVLAGALAARFDAVLLSTDMVRLELHGRPEAKGGSGLNQERYSAASREVVYDEIAKQAEALIGAGRPVVIDGTYIERRRREPIVDVATRAGAPLLVVDGGFSSRLSPYARVVLPQPDSPARPRISPRCSVSDTSRTALTGGSTSYSIETLRAVSTASPVHAAAPFAVRTDLDATARALRLARRGARSRARGASFGLMISSIEKLMSERPAPSSAMMRPGGTNHHQAPVPSAWPVCASLSIVPSVIEPVGPRPRYDSPASPRIAKMIAKRNCAASSGSRFGRISTRMMRVVLLAGDPGRGDVVAGAQRPRLRPQHDRRARPAGDAEHDRDEHRSCGPGHVAGDHDDERQAGDDEHDVREEREDLVGTSRRVARR